MRTLLKNEIEVVSGGLPMQTVTVYGHRMSQEEKDLYDWEYRELSWDQEIFQDFREWFMDLWN